MINFRVCGTTAQLPGIRVTDAVARIAAGIEEPLFGRVDVVAVEGLYPSKRRHQLVSTWADYETLLAKGAPLAIDLNHLRIVARYDVGWQQDIVEALLSSPQLREVHLSDNDGHADQHSVCSAPPWWWPVLNAISLPVHAVVFTEGNALGQLRGRSI